jgi:formate/nitrite transporter
MGYYKPSEVVSIVNNAAIEKSGYLKRKTFVLAILAGAYIAIGGVLAIMIGGGVPEIAKANPGIQKLLFGAFFPLGLLLVVFAGAELFTGNTMYFVPSTLSKAMKIKVPLKNWTIVYFGNFVGALLVAYFLAYQTDIFASDPWFSTVMNIAEKKVHSDFWTVFYKAVACNWLVCLSIWIAFASKHSSGKIIGLWFPVMAFVAIGFEHSVANMFFIPSAIFYGADITWTSFIVDNLIPATIGNIVGGAFFVGTTYWYVYEKATKVDKTVE